MPSAELSLPPLREDLVLHTGPAQRDGAPSWTIEDPLRGRFFRIGWLEFEMLSRWHCGNASVLAEQMAKETLLHPDVAEVLAVRGFLRGHELLVDPEQMRRLAAAPPPRPGIASQALHHYLMLRIPLVNPDAWLTRWLPVFTPLLGARAFWASIWAALAGLFFTLQQWEQFSASFVETLSWQGLASYGLALVFAKILHELGHAFTAKQLGLRVPRMGVAIVLLLPMLYTDTGETWRLTRRRDRFAIAAAGMRIELMLAAWCTLAWAFLPDGALRGAVFFLATTSWVMTLAINASPFMRFDGYYMMSDATGIANLHEEAASVLKHWLRTRLLGWQAPAPAIEGERSPGWLVWFGLGTAVYRFFLFLGIALAVYHYFFKALGLFLFVVEVWWFILKPVAAELRIWWRNRDRIRAWARVRLGLAMLVPALLLVLPWQSRIQAQGWVRAAQEFTVYSPRPARLLQLPQAGQVEAHGRLAELASPDLVLRGARANARLSGLDSRLLAATGAEQLMESVRSTREQISQQWAEVRGANAETRQLQLLTPFRGWVVDVAADLAPGQVVGRQDVLARVIDPSQWVAEAFVDEDERQRLKLGARVRAYLHGIQQEVIGGVIDEIDTAPLDQLPADMLAARHGGFVVTTEDPSQLRPRQPLYRVRVLLQHGPATRQARLAGFNIEGERMSLIVHFFRAALGTLMLQASF